MWTDIIAGLRHRRHVDLCLCGDSIFTAPKARDGLVLRVECQTWFTVKRAGTAAGHTLLISSEAEPAKC